MRKTAWLILFLFVAKIISAQCDVEYKAAEDEKNDTLTFKMYSRLLECYYKTDDFDGGGKVISKLEALMSVLVKKYKDSTYYRFYLGEITIFYFYKGDMVKCLEASNTLLNYNYRRSDLSQIAGSLGNIAILYRKSGNYPKAIHYLQESIKLNSKIGKKDLAGNYSNLANVYSDINQPDKAKEYFIKALRLRLEQNDEKGIALSYANLGNYYSNNEQFDSAIYYYSKAIFLNEKQHAPDSKKALTLNNYTGLFIQQNKLDSAIKYLKLTEKLLNEKSNPFMLAHFYEHRGDISKRQHKFK